MRRPIIGTALLLAALASGCGSGGGGSDDDLDPGGEALAANFTPDAAPAAAASVTAQPGGRTADVVTVDVVVTDTTGIFSVAFDLVYDPARAAYLSAAEGSLLDGDGAATQFLVAQSAGRLVVGASRLQDPGGTVPDVDAVGQQVLASFRFRLLAAGASRLDFDAAAPRSVQDRNGVARAVSWSGGTLVAN